MRPTRVSVFFFIRNTENQINGGKECINTGTVEELYDPQKDRKKSQIDLRSYLPTELKL